MMMASNFQKQHGEIIGISVAVAFIIRLQSQPDEGGRPKRRLPPSPLGPFGPFQVRTASCWEQEVTI